MTRYYDEAAEPAEPTRRKTPTDRPTVGDRLDAATKLLRELDEALDGLTERLTVTLRPEVPGRVALGGVTDDNTSPLGDNLARLTLGLRALTDRVHSLTEQVDL